MRWIVRSSRTRCAGRFLGSVAFNFEGLTENRERVAV